MVHTQVDVIIPSNGKNSTLVRMTQKCIDSLVDSEKNIKFNILVFEQNTMVRYMKAKTIHYSYPFNYNKVMNDGISRTESPFVCMANNDLIFGKGWCTKLIEYSEKYMSMSPRCPKSQVDMNKNLVYEGYGIARELSGWCIFCKREVFDIIGKLDESRIFWWSDNVYADALQRHNIKHALISNSIVQHLGSKTTLIVGIKTMTEYIEKQKEEWKK